MTAIVNYPWVEPFLSAHFEFGGVSSTLAVRSVLNGGVQTSEVPGKRWKASMTLPSATLEDRAAVEAFFDSLNGQATRVRIWHMGRLGRQGHGSPMGTINTTGVTVKTDAAQFATQFTIAGCGNATTLEAGDMLAVNGQLLMNPAQAVANAGGDMVVKATGGLRQALTAGMAVTLIKPTALFILSNPDWRASYTNGAYSTEFAIDFEEVFA